MVTRLDSSHVFHRMTRLVSSHSQWLETRVRVIFAKSLSLWWANPIRLHTKKWTFFASVMIKIGGNFLLWLSSCAMLHFKYQVYPTCVEAGLRLCFHSGVSRGTIYWHLIVTPYRDTLSTPYRLVCNIMARAVVVAFAYRHHGSGSHTVTLCLFQIPIKWSKFFRFKSKPKLYCKI